MILSLLELSAGPAFPIRGMRADQKVRQQDAEIANATGLASAHGVALMLMNDDSRQKRSYK
jgi:hypothetical protein